MSFRTIDVFNPNLGVSWSVSSTTKVAFISSFVGVTASWLPDALINGDIEEDGSVSIGDELFTINNVKLPPLNSVEDLEAILAKRIIKFPTSLTFKLKGKQDGKREEEEVEEETSNFSDVSKIANEAQSMLDKYQNILRGGGAKGFNNITSSLSSQQDFNTSDYLSPIPVSRQREVEKYKEEYKGEGKVEEEEEEEKEEDDEEEEIEKIEKSNSESDFSSFVSDTNKVRRDLDRFLAPLALILKSQSSSFYAEWKRLVSNWDIEKTTTKEMVKLRNAISKSSLPNKIEICSCLDVAISFEMKHNESSNEEEGFSYTRGNKVDELLLVNEDGRKAKRNTKLRGESGESETNKGKELKKQPSRVIKSSKRNPLIGIRILVDRQSNKKGTVRFVGSTHFGDGLWIGVELDFPKGDNSGKYENIRYFHCNANTGQRNELHYGIFVRKDRISVPRGQPPLPSFEQDDFVIDYKNMSITPKSSRSYEKPWKSNSGKLTSLNDYEVSAPSALIGASREGSKSFSGTSNTNLLNESISSEMLAGDIKKMREDIQARFESVTALQKEQNSEVALMLDQWRKEMKHIFNDTNKQSNHTTLLKAINDLESELIAEREKRLKAEAIVRKSSSSFSARSHSFSSLSGYSETGHLSAGDIVGVASGQVPPKLFVSSKDNEEGEVSEWLNSLNLEKYHNILLEKGFLKLIDFALIDEKIVLDFPMMTRTERALFYSACLSLRKRLNVKKSSNLTVSTSVSTPSSQASSTKHSTITKVSDSPSRFGNVVLDLSSPFNNLGSINKNVLASPSPASFTPSPPFQPSKSKLHSILNNVIKTNSVISSWKHENEISPSPSFSTSGVAVWLSGIGLSEYTHAFESKGINRLSLVSKLDEESIRAMGIKPRHESRLVDAVKSLGDIIVKHT